MNADYLEGRAARGKYQSTEACPHGYEASDYEAPTAERAESPMCRRHWWLAGWHDRDMEVHRIITEGAA